VKVAAVVQARMGSSRLPGKVLLNITRDRCVLDYVIDRLKHCSSFDDIVLAVPLNPNDNVLKDYASSKNICLFRGDEFDVLGRYYHAANCFDVDRVVRVTGDCPLVDPVIVDMIVRKHLNSDADYTSNVIVRSFPRGFDVEVFNFDVLQDVFHNATRGYQREHVTVYIREHPELFKLVNITSSGVLRNPDVRLTLDTYQDYLLIKSILDYFGNYFFSAWDVMGYLSMHPELLDINQMVHQKDILVEDGGV